MPPKGERRKQQIIDTAKKMFLEKGFQSTHIGQVCEELDIARGTVYQYFSNKKEILYAILDTVAEAIEDNLDADDLKDFLHDKPDNDVIMDFIDKRIASCLTVFSEEPIVIKLIFREIPGTDDEVVEKVSEFLGKIISTLSKEITTLRDAGIFKKDISAGITASMLIGSIMMIVYQYTVTNKNYLDKKVTTTIANHYLHGVYTNNGE
jgi:AcrR family transcriptional regulator